MAWPKHPANMHGNLLQSMSELDIEQAFCVACAKAGMLANKYATPGRRSAPDRIVLAGDGYVEFVECKAPGEVPTPAQLEEHRELRELGYTVTVLDSLSGISTLVGAIKRRATKPWQSHF